MVDCSCVNTEQNNGEETVTSLVTYDGGSQSCIPFNEGTVNDLATAINQAICDLKDQLADLGLTTDDIILNGFPEPDPLCPIILDGQTVTEAITCIMSTINTLFQELGELNTNNITTIDITPIPNCIGIENETTLTEAINLIIDYVCNCCEESIKPPDHKKRPTRGDYNNPFIPYVSSTMTCTDTSGGGVAKVTFGALEYYVDDRNVVKISEQVELGDNADNYIYLDNTNSWDYAVSSVAIGNPAPMTNGELIVVARTGVGTVTSITQLIADYPIDNTLLADDSVAIRNLNDDVVKTDGGLDIDSSGLHIAYDNITIGINPAGPGSHHPIYVKDDSITKEKINADIAGTGLSQGVGGELNVNTNMSVTTSGDDIVLNGDSASPGNNKVYKTNSFGVRGWRDEIYVPFKVTVPSADVLNLFSVPYQIIATPGARKINQVMCYTIHNEFNSVAYDNGTDTLDLKYVGGQVIESIDATFIEAVSEDLRHGNPTVATTINIIGSENEAINLQTSSADPTLGDSDIIIEGYYRTITN